MKNRTDYDKIIQGMEPGVDRAVLRVLSFHVGKDNKVTRDGLVELVKASGFGKLGAFTTLDRQVRMAIAELRKHGELICSSSGEGGYWLASDRAEYDEFAQVELRAKIIDMSSTLTAMDQAAARRFGSDTPAEQLGLL